MCLSALVCVCVMVWVDLMGVKDGSGTGCLNKGGSTRESRRHTNGAVGFRGRQAVYSHVTRVVGARRTGRCLPGRTAREGRAAAP